jgi:Cd2+/Zn2+-exporting ATPase
LVKQGATVEAMAKVDTVAFDKTGTLTFGEPRLVDVVALNGLAETEVLGLSAVAEKFSEHPLGRAVVRAAEERGLSAPDPEGFEALPGLGVGASTNGHQLSLGRSEALAGRGVKVGGEVEEQAMRLAAPGRTVVLLADGTKATGLLAFEDGIRPEAKATVERLNGLGVPTVLITGDNRTTAERIAAEPGIAEVHAEVLPRQEVEIVKGLQAEAPKVAFVATASTTDRPWQPPRSGLRWSWRAPTPPSKRRRLGCSPTTSPSCRTCSGSPVRPSAP